MGFVHNWLSTRYKCFLYTLQRYAIAKNDKVRQICEISIEILKMTFSILHAFHQISRTFNFFDDLDLACDLDL